MMTRNSGTGYISKSMHPNEHDLTNNLKQACIYSSVANFRLDCSIKFSSLCADEGPPCTCPLCASDWSSCVPHSEGLQLSRDLGATYLELPSLNHVFVGRYFGSVVSDHITLQFSVHNKNSRTARAVVEEKNNNRAGCTE